MTTTTTVSQNAKILATLQSGKTLTPAQAEARFGVKRMSARILELRAAGHPIFTSTNKSGTTTYSMGAPTQAMIAAAYYLEGASVFN